MIGRAIILLVVLLTGCAPRFVASPIEPQGRESVSIGILPVNYLEKLSVAVVEDPLAALPGGGNDALDAALNARQYDYRPRLHSLLLLRLNQAGVGAGYLPRPAEIAPGGRPERAFHDAWDPDSADVDFLLDVYVDFAGYMATGEGEPYRPTLQLAYRLVDATSGETIGQNRVTYNGAPDGVAVTVEADPADAFESEASLLENESRARNGLDRAIMGATSALAARLADVLLE